VLHILSPAQKSTYETKKKRKMLVQLHNAFTKLTSKFSYLSQSDKIWC